MLKRVKYKKQVQLEKLMYSSLLCFSYIYQHVMTLIMGRMKTKNNQFLL